MIGRTLVIGDIHGGLRALEQVLDRVDLQKDDYLIFLGDYVDGWSEAAQVINYLLELQQNYRCDFIYGNHDGWCHDWLQGKEVPAKWYIHGGQQTSDSYQGLTTEEKEAHIAFFNQMKYYMIDNKNRLFIHAGFTSLHGPEYEMFKENCAWDRTLWEMSLALHGKIESDDPFFPKRLQRFDEIYMGHTPTTNYGIEYPWNRVNVWNIDTGAAFKGKLTVLDVDTKDYWQSDVLPSLYPNEKGRN